MNPEEMTQEQAFQASQATQATQATRANNSIEEIKTLRQIIVALKRNNMHLNYDVEKTRQWAISADRELDVLKGENSALQERVTVLTDDNTVLTRRVTTLTSEIQLLKEQNASLHDILNGL